MLISVVSAETTEIASGVMMLLTLMAMEPVPLATALRSLMVVKTEPVAGTDWPSGSVPSATFLQQTHPHSFLVLQKKSLLFFHVLDEKAQQFYIVLQNQQFPGRHPLASM